MFMLYRRYKNNNAKENKVFGLENFYPHSIDHMTSESERNIQGSVENDVKNTSKPVFDENIIIHSKFSSFNECNIMKPEN